MTSFELTHFKEMVRVWKTKSLLVCLRCDPLIVFWKANSYNFHFHKNDVTWPLSVNGLFTGVFECHNKTKFFAKKTRRLSGKPALLKLRFPRRKRTPWPSLPRLRSALIISWKLDKFTLFTSVYPFSCPLKLGKSLQTCCVNFFLLSWHFKREKSVFWKASFLQNKNWLRDSGLRDCLEMRRF